MAVDDGPRLSTARVLARGLARRCPVCGGGGLTERPLRLKARCPRCGFPFERVEGHWIGAVGVNTIVTFGLLLVTLVVGFVVTYPDIAVGPLVAVGIVVALVFPVAFYPVSRTLWSAIDLLLRPLEPEDDVDPRYWPAGRGHG